jgi:GT2 family glycosyltransferase
MRIDIVMPSYRSEYLTCLAIKSFEQNKSTFDFRYIVVENSDDTSYRDKVKSISENVVWVQNPTNLINSEANAIAVEKGLELVETELVFICHNDVAAVDPSWMHFLLSKINEGNKLVGTVLDNIRIKAVHISGFLTYTKFAKENNMYPTYEGSTQILDVGDILTQKCIEDGSSFFCCDNTENNDLLVENLDEEFKSFGVDRCLDDSGKVIFLHLGRGTPKSNGTYSKPNRIYLKDWVKFIVQKLG